jgi:uncharacterized repeat protein (TIGR01451 family)
MFKGKKSFFALVALAVCGLSSQAHAVEQGCILLKSVAEVETEVVDANGQKSTRLVPATKVVPGVQVTWTVTANNICKQPSETVTINNAVPEHMSYVANSATGPGSDITFSVDGKTFGAPAQLTVEEDGGTRQARADEYRHIRWSFKDSLAPGAQAHARFRAVLN